MMTIEKSTGELVKCKVNTMQLPEQLGLINHILSDKTGTLTKNELVFKAISVAG